MTTRRPYVMGFGGEEGRAGMEESGTRRLDVIGRLDRPRIAALMGRVDAGEREALVMLEDRLRQECRYLDSEGKRDLADAARGWLEARFEDVERAEAYASREDAGAEAPARWTGLRMRVSYVASRGLAHPTEVVARLAGVNECGLHVLIDDLEEERNESADYLAGSIARRVRAERLICWPALLTVQPLPVLEEAGANWQESGNGKENGAQTNVESKSVEESYVALGQLIRRIRRVRGWSMRELAEASSLDLDTVSNTEKARHRPRPETLERLARSLGSPIAVSDGSRPGVSPDERAQRLPASRIDP